jgi:DNA-binding beta-propeller fold protein YncE
MNRALLRAAFALVLAESLLAPATTAGEILVSGNEGKYDLSGGVGRVVENPEPDSLTILDFATFPPRSRHVMGVANSVVGPPTNIAITPDGRLALVANSVRRYTDDPKRPAPDNVVQVIDLAGESPGVIDRVRVGAQPSGIGINRQGDLAIVANRADGTLSVLSIRGSKVAVEQTLSVGDATSEPADVAISPAGTLALVSLNKAAVVRVLRIAKGRAELANRKIPVYGQPYHVQITPDGALGLVAGGGNQNGPDVDLVSVIDLTSEPIRTVDHFVVGTGPESFDISPDGRLLAVVLMEGSNVAADDPQRTEHGYLRLWKRAAKSFVKLQELPIARVPEGIAFTSDGRYLVVQEHAARQLSLFEVAADGVRDTGVRITVPGFPSSLRRIERSR